MAAPQSEKNPEHGSPELSFLVSSNFSYLTQKIQETERKIKVQNLLVSWVHQFFFIQQSTLISHLSYINPHFKPHQIVTSNFPRSPAFIYPKVRKSPLLLLFILLESAASKFGCLVQEHSRTFKQNFGDK